MGGGALKGPSQRYKWARHAADGRAGGGRGGKEVEGGVRERHRKGKVRKGGKEKKGE